MSRPSSRTRGGDPRPLYKSNNAKLGCVAIAISLVGFALRLDIDSTLMPLSMGLALLLDLVSKAFKETSRGLSVTATVLSVIAFLIGAASLVIVIVSDILDAHAWIT